MNQCASCGMPLEKQEDIGTQNENGIFCKFCTDAQGNVKPCEEIFEGGVQFFMQAIPGTSRELAEKITCRNMNTQPYWKGKELAPLQRPQASDEEFARAMARL